MIKLLLLILFNFAFSGGNQSSLSQKENLDVSYLGTNKCRVILDIGFNVEIEIINNQRTSITSRFKTIKYSKKPDGRYKLELVELNNDQYAYELPTLYCNEHLGKFDFGLAVSNKLFLNIELKKIKILDKQGKTIILIGQIILQDEYPEDIKLVYTAPRDSATILKSDDLPAHNSTYKEDISSFVSIDDPLKNKTLQLNVTNSKLLKKIIIQRKNNLYLVRIETSFDLSAENLFKLASYTNENGHSILSFVTVEDNTPVFNINLSHFNHDDTPLTIGVNSQIFITKPSLSSDITNNILVKDDKMYRLFISIVLPKFTQYTEHVDYSGNTVKNLNNNVKFTCNDLLLRPYNIYINFTNNTNIKQLSIIRTSQNNLYSILTTSGNVIDLNNAKILCVDNDDGANLTISDKDTNVVKFVISNDFISYRLRTSELIVNGSIIDDNLQGISKYNIWSYVIDKLPTSPTENKIFKVDQSFEYYITNFNVLLIIDNNHSKIESIYIPYITPRNNSHQVGVKYSNEDPVIERFSTMEFFPEDKNKMLLTLGEINARLFTLGHSLPLTLDPGKISFHDNVVKIHVKYPDLEPFDCNFSNELNYYLFNDESRSYKFIITRINDKDVNIYSQLLNQNINHYILKDFSLTCELTKDNDDNSDEEIDVYKIHITGKIFDTSVHSYDKTYSFPKDRSFFKSKNSHSIDVIRKYAIPFP